jgi:hypothetical protein
MSKKRLACAGHRPTDDNLHRVSCNQPATIEDLIKRLRAFAKLAPRSPVVLSKDGEGNEFSPLIRVCLGMYEPRDDYVGDLREPNENCRGVLAVVLWPIS